GGLGAERQPELEQLAIEDEQRREPRRELEPEGRRDVSGDDRERVEEGAVEPRLAGDPKLGGAPGGDEGGVWLAGAAVTGAHLGDRQGVGAVVLQREGVAQRVALGSGAE